MRGRVPARLALTWTGFLFGSGCTVLGPVPLTTMTSPVQSATTSLEMQVAAVPGYYLSETADPEKEAQGALAQGALMLNTGDLGMIPGQLHMGLRQVNGLTEPLVRWHAGSDRHTPWTPWFAAFGSPYHADSHGASMRMLRLGGEVGLGLRIVPWNNWSTLHLTGSFGWTSIRAEAAYCRDAFGVAEDCECLVRSESGEQCRVWEDTNSETNLRITMPALTLGVVFATFRDLPILKGLNLQFGWTFGTIPDLREVDAYDVRSFQSLALSVTTSLGP